MAAACLAYKRQSGKYLRVHLLLFIPHRVKSIIYTPALGTLADSVLPHEWSRGPICTKNKFRRFWGGFSDGELPGCQNYLLQPRQWQNKILKKELSLCWPDKQKHRQNADSDKWWWKKENPFVNVSHMSLAVVLARLSGGMNLSILLGNWNEDINDSRGGWEGKGNQSISSLSKPISPQTYQKSSTSQQHLWLLACSCEGNPPCSSSSTPLLFFSFISIGDLDIKAMDLKAMILHTPVYFSSLSFSPKTPPPLHILWPSIQEKGSSEGYKAMTGTRRGEWSCNWIHSCRSRLNSFFCY